MTTPMILWSPPSPVPAGPRYSVPLHQGLPALRLVDPFTIEEIALRARNCADARPILELLGCVSRPDSGQWTLPHTQHRRLEATLRGDDPGRRAVILDELGRADRRMATTIEATDLALLAGLGLDMPTCLLLAIARDVSEPCSTDALHLVSPDGSLQARLAPTRVGSDTAPADPPVPGRADTRIRRLALDTVALGRSAHWWKGTVLVDPLPETTISALAGRPLTDLVSHPVLDPLGLVITDASNNEEIELAEVRTDHRPEHIPLARILEGWR